MDSKLIGDRPAGSVLFDSLTIQAAVLATSAAGVPTVAFRQGSNDANLAVRLGIPAPSLPPSSMHCTGERFIDLLRQKMPNRVVYSNVSSRYTFGMQ